MQVEILNISGKKTTKKVDLIDSIFAVEPNDHCIYLDVKQFLANQRQGTHKSKERAEISRTTKKLKKQKGTGGARAGSMKSPLFIGGGRAFGPRPRDYSFKLNKKVKTLARLSALAYKAKDNAITVLEDFTFEAPKTKNYIDLIKNLNLTDKKTLLVLGDTNKNVYLSSRNIQGAKVVSASDLNTYDILNAETLILAEGSIKVLETILNK
ncbi:MAG: 50S ribosomal protein L4 [Bacteroidota bacterium]|nr:50S ribosomal protein L4 [Bacteroidota bacterium]MDP3146417.1 50S ribosomal protein L4 [Bacteroidota bacterium]MDP3557403.1 50S ribosomal protein L4 [Bacteroidota bacterium]